MREHRAFGAAGRSAGIENDRVVAGLAFDESRDRHTGWKTGFEDLDARSRGARGSVGNQRSPADQDLCPRIAQDKGDLLGGEQGVDRDHHRAESQHAVIGTREIGGVEHEDRHPVARADA